MAGYFTSPLPPPPHTFENQFYEINIQFYEINIQFYEINIQFYEINIQFYEINTLNATKFSLC